jgi:tRNA nucleotidyltransferase (CCA-adding enzyme)
VTVAPPAPDEAEDAARVEAVLPAHVRAVCERLTRAGHEAVTVGGAVRDALLGRAPGDWDVATSAPPDAVRALFPHTVPTGLAHGTVTVVTGRGAATHVEVTTYRGEGAYTDARRPDRVTFGVPLAEDLARRDLRVNAIAYDPERRRVIDPYAGRADLRAGRLRAVGTSGDVYADAVARFTEDGLRVMRAVRFAATLELALDPETERGIGPALPSLAKVSKERIAVELRKILASREPSRALAPAARTGMIALIAPELDGGAGAAWATAPGGREAAVARWLARVDAAPPAARLGAWLTDLAAPPGAPARGIDRAAVRRAQGALRRLKLSNEEIAASAVQVGAAPAAAAPPAADAEVRQLLAEVTRPHAHGVIGLWRALGAAALADRAAAILERGDPLATGELAVTGTDLMAALGLPPGPAVGRLLAALLARALVEPALNDRARLVALAAELAPQLAR